VLRMLFMHSSTGLAIPAGIVVLCRFWTGAMAPAPFPSPAPFTGPPDQPGLRPRGARGPRVEATEQAFDRRTTGTRWRGESHA
jgi:hypothetical protein